MDRRISIEKARGSGVAQDPLALAEVIHQGRPLLLGRREGQRIEPAILMGVAEQSADPPRDGAGHVDGDRDAGGPRRADQGGDLGQRAFVAQAAPRDVGEGDRPADDLAPPPRVVRPVGEGDQSPGCAPG